MENLIEVRGLCKRYKNFSLEGVDLTLPAGQIPVSYTHLPGLPPSLVTSTEML